MFRNRKTATVFVSYRRSDSSGHTGRLTDRLHREFGEARYFRDIDTIKLGSNFVQAIEAAVGSCSVFIALIGPAWASATDSTGRLRLEDPNDFVRLEISSALKRKIPIIPVLVGGATLPRPESLPVEIRGLLEFEAHELSDRRWAYDLDQLIVQIKDILDPRWRLRRNVLTTVFALLVLSGTVAIGRRLISNSSLLHIPRFAIVNPTNSTHDSGYDYLSTQMGENLNADLTIPSKLNVIPPEDVLSVLDDLSVGPDQCAKRVDPGPLRDVLGASYLILGNYLKAADHPNSIHVKLCLEDAYGRVLDRFDDSGPVEKIADFMAQAAKRFRDASGFAGLAVADVQGLYPANRDALRLYFDGLGKLRSFNARDALTSLQQSAALEDSNALVHAAMADAWSLLRHGDEAKREAELALEWGDRPSVVPLPIEYRDAIKARAAEINGQWKDAEKFYDSLSHSFPERLDYGLKLASVRTSGLDPQAALKAVQELKKLPHPLGQDPRIFIEESKAYVAMADHKNAVRAADAAVNIAEAKNAHLLKATALIQRCWANRQLGDPNAMGDCDEAQKIFEVFKDDVAAAIALNDMAIGLSDHRKFDEAKDTLDHVISVTEHTNDSVDLAGALLNSARVSILMGDRPAAVRLLRRAFDVSESGKDKYDQVLIAINWAEIDRQDGHLTDSAKHAAEARDLAKLISDRSSEAYALGALALAQSEAGDLPGALQDYELSRDIRKDLGEDVEVTITATRVGDVDLRLARFADAEKQYSDALQAFAGPLNRPDLAMVARLDLVQVDVEREHFADAVTGANSALPEIADVDTDSRADALSFLVRALVGQRKLPDAAQHFQEMKQVKFSDPDVGIDVALAEGMYLTESGDPKQAVDMLEAAADRAMKSGRSFAALKLQLAAVEAREKSKDHVAAEKELAQVLMAAQSCAANLGTNQHCGFPLITQQAKKRSRSLGA